MKEPVSQNSGSKIPYFDEQLQLFAGPIAHIHVLLVVLFVFVRLFRFGLLHFGVFQVFLKIFANLRKSWKNKPDFFSKNQR